MCSRPRRPQGLQTAPAAPHMQIPSTAQLWDPTNTSAVHRRPAGILLASAQHTHCLQAEVSLRLCPAGTPDRFPPVSSYDAHLSGGCEALSGSSSRMTHNHASPKAGLWNRSPTWVIGQSRNAGGSVSWALGSLDAAAAAAPSALPTSRLRAGSTSALRLGLSSAFHAVHLCIMRTSHGALIIAALADPQSKGVRHHRAPAIPASCMEGALTLPGDSCCQHGAAQSDCRAEPDGQAAEL